MAQIAYLAAVAIMAYGQYEKGQAEKQQAQRIAAAKEFEAEQLDQQAGNEIAAGQRRALEARRQARIVQSRALAVSAAQGGATDPTVIDIISDLAAEGDYRAAVALYEGEERARLARMGAVGARYEAAGTREYGRAAARAGTITAIGSLGTGIYGKYGRVPDPDGAGGGTLDAGTPGLYPYA